MQAATAVQTTHVRFDALAQRLPALAVLAFGLLLLFGVGFVTLPAAHNAVHDTRHAMGFPCH